MNAHQLYRLSSAAEELGVPRETIKAAIKRGDIQAHHTACGLPLVTLAAVRLFVKRAPSRRRGPKSVQG